MKESPLFWPAFLRGSTLHVLDETLLPSRQKYIKVKTPGQAVRVIRDMKTRAFGQFLVVMNTFLLVIMSNKRASNTALLKKIQHTAKMLNNSRPTFPFSEVTGIVVGWVKKAIDGNLDVSFYVEKNIKGFLVGIRAKRLARVEKLASLIKDGDSILTHCNVSGELAMAAQLCKKQKKQNWVFATETRPYFQGAKLTCWELQKAGVSVTLVSDSAVGSLLSDKLVNVVVVGSDRSCANGDIANKIGTYQIAVLAKEFGVPVYALTQPSRAIKKGDNIPIEIRDENELLSFYGKRIAPKGVKGLYPGFDIVPHSLIKHSVAINVN